MPDNHAVQKSETSMFLGGAVLQALGGSMIIGDSTQGLGALLVGCNALFE